MSTINQYSASVIKILIADDEKDIRDIVMWYLNRERFQVFAAADGNAAMEVAELHSPDLSNN